MKIDKINNENISWFTSLINESPLRFHEGSFYLLAEFDEEGNELPTPIIYRLAFELSNISQDVFDEMDIPTY